MSVLVARSASVQDSSSAAVSSSFDVAATLAEAALAVGEVGGVGERRVGVDGSVWRGRGSHFRVPTVSPPPPPPPPPLYCPPLEKENEEEEENNKRRSKQVCDARSFTDNLH